MTIQKTTIKNAIEHAKTNKCNVYFYEDGTYSEHRFENPIGIIQYIPKGIEKPNSYFELWLEQWNGLRFL